MAEPLNQKDPWRFPTLALWLVVFTVGLVPEPVYQLLRAVGGVVTQRALVNSPYMISIALAAWVAMFSFYACRKAGLTPFEAQDRALQLGVAALLAFLPVDLQALVTAHLNPLMRARFALYLAGIAKVIAWWLLLTIVVKYYLFQMYDAFAKVPSLFPSARKPETNNTSPETNSPTAHPEPPSGNGG